MTTQLAFNSTQFNVVSRNNSIYLTAVEIAQALGYKKPDAVTQIYERNCDEFSADMSETLNLSVSGNLEKSVRIFSLRGAHLIAMFARTTVAKEFRRWVLDVLDHEVGQPVIQPSPPAQPKRRAVITYFENEMPVCNRPLLPDEVVITIESFREISERAGNLIIHYTTLRDLTCQDFVRLADKAEKYYLEWKKKMDALPRW